MNIKNLQWEALEGQFGKSWIAEIPGFDSRYCIWVDRESGKTIGANPYREKQEFTSIQQAKDFFQRDFEKKIDVLLNA